MLARLGIQILDIISGSKGILLHILLPSKKNADEDKKRGRDC
jgi:hypothetical protein